MSSWIIAKKLLKKCIKLSPLMSDDEQIQAIIVKYRAGIVVIIIITIIM